MRMQFNRLEPYSYSERIARQIQDLVTSEQLVPGDKLPAQRELAEAFGVSRTAVREALKLLQERGLVEVRTGRGTYVTSPDLATVTSSISLASQMHHVKLGDLLEARRCMEGFIAGLAAERATPADIARLEALVEAMDALSRGSDEFVEADREFHAAMAAATQNPLLVILSKPLVDLIQRVRRVGIGVSGSPERAQVYHKRILVSIKSRDVTRARELALEHLDQFRGDLELAGLENGSGIPFEGV
jgi:GntR family transcriptional repressor for pyruvate dehydrogenase complex